MNTNSSKTPCGPKWSRPKKAGFCLNARPEPEGPVYDLQSTGRDRWVQGQFTGSLVCAKTERCGVMYTEEELEGV